MIDLIEVHIDHSGRASLIGKVRYFAKERSQASIFEYADEWLAFDDAFSIKNDLFQQKLGQTLHGRTARMPRLIARVWRLQVERGSELLRTALRFLLGASWIASGVMNRSL